MKISNEDSRREELKGDKNKREVNAMDELLKKTTDRQLATVEGHIKAIRKMLDDNRGCTPILTQLAAVNKTVKRIALLLLKRQLNNRVDDADTQNIKHICDEIKELLGSYLWFE